LTGVKTTQVVSHQFKLSPALYVLIIDIWRSSEQVYHAVVSAPGNKGLLTYCFCMRRWGFGHCRCFLIAYFF